MSTNIRLNKFLFFPSTRKVDSITATTHIGNNPRPPPILMERIDDLMDLEGWSRSARVARAEVGIKDVLMKRTARDSIFKQRGVDHGMAAVSGERADDGGLIPSSSEAFILALDLDLVADGEALGFALLSF